jgi:hypothetical protein
MNLVVSIILFLLVFTLVFFIFYLRIKALQESKRMLKYFENLRDKFQMQMSFHPKEANHILPILSGQVSHRDTIVERTIQEKYKYIVISIALKNSKNITLQITPKDHLRGKEKVDEAQLVETNITSINNNYFVSANHSEFLKEFLVEYFLKWQKKYASIWFLFSTLVIFRDRITLVLLSVPQRIKYDLVVEQFLLDLQAVADEIEAI